MPSSSSAVTCWGRCRSGTGSSCSSRARTSARSGSGNIGASNVWRTYGRWLGIPIVVLDVAKGFVPALVGALLVGELTAVLAGGAAMLGHWRPLFLRFQKGGKTVATGGGVFLGAAPLLGLIGVAVWIVVFLALALRVAGVDRGRALAADPGGRARRAVADHRLRCDRGSRRPPARTGRTSPACGREPRAASGSGARRPRLAPEPVRE